MTSVDRVSEIACQLEQAILSGEYAAGDQLPSERDISAQQGVSRSVVREALGRLASLGLVRSVRGSGTRVAAPSSRQITVGYERLFRGTEFRLEDLSAVRLPLETTIATLAAQRRTPEQLARLEATQQVLHAPEATLDSHVRADLEFHAILAEASGNPLFQIVLAPIQELLMESRRRTLGIYGAEVALAHHARILEAVAAQDGGAAAEAMRAHIEANSMHLTRLDSRPPAAVPPAGPFGVTPSEVP